MLPQLQLHPEQVKAWNKKKCFPWQVWTWSFIRSSSFLLGLRYLLLNWTTLNQKYQSQRHESACAQWMLPIKWT